MNMNKDTVTGIVAAFTFVSAGVLTLATAQGSGSSRWSGHGFDRVVREHAQRQMVEGRRTFRFDTFGDETFWGGVLRLHDGIKGSALGRRASATCAPNRTS